MQDDFALRYPIERPIWMARLARAENAADVMEVAREFARTHEELWASLPIDLQPPPFTVADDISRYALALYQKELGRTLHLAETVQALGSFFSEAAHRVAFLSSPNAFILRKAFFDRRA